MLVPSLWNYEEWIIFKPPSLRCSVIAATLLTSPHILTRTVHIWQPSFYLWAFAYSIPSAWIAVSKILHLIIIGSSPHPKPCISLHFNISKMRMNLTTNVCICGSSESQTLRNSIIPLHPPGSAQAVISRFSSPLHCPNLGQLYRFTTHIALYSPACLSPPAWRPPWEEQKCIFPSCISCSPQLSSSGSRAGAEGRS